MKLAPSSTFESAKRLSPYLIPLSESAWTTNTYEFFVAAFLITEMYSQCKIQNKV